MKMEKDFYFIWLMRLCIIRRNPIIYLIIEFDMANAMNYLGNELNVTLYKKMYELPTSVLNQELPLRAIEALLVNLLHQKYENPHGILDQFTSNAHLSLKDQKSKFKN
jgi:hypothetical protein